MSNSLNFFSVADTPDLPSESRRPLARLDDCPCVEALKYGANTFWRMDCIISNGETGLPWEALVSLRVAGPWRLKVLIWSWREMRGSRGCARLVRITKAAAVGGRENSARREKMY